MADEEEEVGRSDREARLVERSAGSAESSAATQLLPSAFEGAGSRGRAVEEEEEEEGPPPRAAAGSLPFAMDARGAPAFLAAVTAGLATAVPSSPVEILPTTDPATPRELTPEPEADLAASVDTPSRLAPTTLGGITDGAVHARLREAQERDDKQSLLRKSH